jgi:hypothetical protein
MFGLLEIQALDCASKGVRIVSQSCFVFSKKELMRLCHINGQIGKTSKKIVSVSMNLSTLKTYLFPKICRIFGLSKAKYRYFFDMLQSMTYYKYSQNVVVQNTIFLFPLKTKARSAIGGL